jgi:hypothetical protein
MELTLILALVAALLGGVVLFFLQASRESQPPAVDAFVPTIAPTSAPVASAQLLVTCTEGGATLDAATVNAGADGVPVQVSGAAGEVVAFTSSGAIGYRFVLQEDSVASTLPLHPTTWSVACSVNPGFSPTFATGTAFTVADPHDRYVATSPDGEIAAGCAWRGVLDASYRRNPERAIRSALADDGLVGGDQVERAGYPTLGFRSYPPASDVYRVVRDDVILARLDVVRAEGQWRYSVLGCVD